MPDPRQLAGSGTVLVDGTICPTWDWRAVPDLFSGKAGYPDMNFQIGATVAGKLVAVGTQPVHGAVTTRTPFGNDRTVTDTADAPPNSPPRSTRLAGAA